MADVLSLRILGRKGVRFILPLLPGKTDLTLIR